MGKYRGKIYLRHLKKKQALMIVLTLKYYRYFFRTQFFCEWKHTWKLLIRVKPTCRISWLLVQPRISENFGLSFLTSLFLDFVCYSRLNFNNLQLHKTLAPKNIFIQEKFNPGSALTSFWISRPRCLTLSYRTEDSGKSYRK